MTDPDPSRSSLRRDRLFIDMSGVDWDDDASIESWARGAWQAVNTTWGERHVQAAQEAIDAERHPD